MEPRLRFGIIGTGSIAAEFADGLAAAESAALVAVASRDAATAAAFAERHGRVRAHTGYESLLRDLGPFIQDRPTFDDITLLVLQTEKARRSASTPRGSSRGEPS